MIGYPQIGDTVTCAETGLPFIVKSIGCTVNYATVGDGKGNNRYVSIEGVDIRERRELLNRSKPMFGYISGDAKSFTGFLGNILGTITSYHSIRNNFAGRLYAVRVTDVHGAHWYGRGLGNGMCIVLHPCKGN